MAHFVALPPRANSQVPDPSFRELAIYDSSGNGAIGVWGCGDEWEIVSDTSNTLVAEAYKQTGLVTHFMLRGLRSGDNIYVVDDKGNAQTGVLRVRFVPGANKAANNVAAQRHQNRFILDPKGIAQAATPVSAQDWIAAVKRTLDYIMTNPVGQRVVASLTFDVTIHPYTGAYMNATSGVQFTPQMWQANYQPGARPNEVLFHELCHVAESSMGGYDDIISGPPGSPGAIPGGNLRYDNADFFTVTATNVYASFFNRPFRRDHRSMERLPAMFNGDEGARRFASEAYGASNFRVFKGRRGALHAQIAGIPRVWNPFKYS